MLFDSHTHIQLEQYDSDRDEVIRRALDVGVWMVNVGTNFADSKKAIALAHAHKEGVYASVGLHPNEVARDFDFIPYAALARDAKAVGIGETGLDYFRITNNELRIRQKELFIAHIELSQKIKKPLIIHCREAHEDAAAVLNAHGKGVAGVAHFFTGTKEDARRYLDLGLYISFSGVVTFTRDYDEVVKYVPLDRLLIETDAPFAAPVPHRGKRNEPSFVTYTVQRIAELKSVSFEEMAEKTTINARALFKINEYPTKKILRS